MGPLWQKAGLGEMKALTFDIGMKMSGWFVNGTDMTRPFWGHYAIPKWSSDPDGHTVGFRNLARTLITTHKPDIIGYEEPWIDQATLDYEFSECQLSLIAQLWVLKHDLKVPRIFKVKPGVWMKLVTGYKGPPPEIGNKKHNRREWWKAKVMQQMRDRNWLITNQDEADAGGINLYCLTMLDKKFASTQGPLFRRAEMKADREAMTR